MNEYLIQETQNWKTLHRNNLKERMYYVSLDSVSVLVNSLVPTDNEHISEIISLTIETLSAIEKSNSENSNRFYPEKRHAHSLKTLAFLAKLVKGDNEFSFHLSENHFEQILNLSDSIVEERDIWSNKANVLVDDIWYCSLIHSNGSLAFKDKIWKRVSLHKGAAAELIFKAGHHMKKTAVLKWNPVPSVARVETYLFYQSAPAYSLLKWVKVNPEQWKQDLFDVLDLRGFPVEDKNTPVSWLEELVKNLCKVEDEN